MIALLFALLAADPAPVVLSLEARAAIAPIHAAYAKVEAEQAALPPPRNDAERLERLLDLDQAGRAALSLVDYSKLPKAEKDAANKAMWSEIRAHDVADQLQLKMLLPPEGWFAKSKYGSKAAQAAFLIVQHAVNDEALMRTTLAKMEPLVAKGEARGPYYALLFDRISLEFDHKPQRYGSQIHCKDGRAQPMDLEDPEHVDERRKAIGFTQTEVEYLAMFKDMRCG